MDLLERLNVLSGVFFFTFHEVGRGAFWFCHIIVYRRYSDLCEINLLFFFYVLTISHAMFFFVTNVF